MKLGRGVFAGIVLIIIVIFGFTMFDLSGEVSVIKVRLEVIEFDGKPVILESSAEQSSLPRMKRSTHKLQDFPAVASHAIINSTNFSEWGCVEYSGPGEYEIVIDFKEDRYPKANDTVVVISYIYDKNAKAVSKDTISLIWE